MVKKIKSFRVAMDDDVMKRFEEIKELLGLDADAEVIRFLINHFYRSYILKKKDIEKIVEDMI